MISFLKIQVWPPE